MGQKDLTPVIAPESLEIANAYLMYGNINAVCKELSVPGELVVQTLNKPEVKRYVDNVFLDMGYRNRSNIASLLDEMILSKLEEAKETEVYTSKDLFDLLSLAHKMRMDELKMQVEQEKVKATTVRNQTNVQINGEGSNYSKLLEKLTKT